MSLGKLILILAVGFFVTHCHEMEFSEMGSSLSDQERDKPPTEEYFRSDKLDLAFVVDTRKGMDSFLQRVFTSRLINHLKDYDVRVAYTNTSVSKAFIEPAPQEKGEPERHITRDDKENPKLCQSGDWLYRIGAIAAGLYFTSPIAFVMGMRGTGKCITKVGRAAGNSVKKLFQGKGPPPVNGLFLPFERADGGPTNYLTLEQGGYEEIFTNTFKTGTAGYNEFDAPQIQKGASDPLAAVLLSFLRKPDVFRENSQKVFVVITSRDTMEVVSFARTQEIFQQIYGEDNLLQIIPVTPMGGMPCLQRLESAGVDRPEYALNLQRSVSDKIQPLNLCGFDLTARLAGEIKQFVSPVRPAFPEKSFSLLK